MNFLILNLHSSPCNGRSDTMLENVKTFHFPNDATIHRRTTPSP